MRILARARRSRAGRHGARSRPSAALFDRAVAEFFMRLALAEASKGVGRTSPNPAVGAVLVKNGRVIARGHHARAGAPHAEVVALRAAGARAEGADLYSTLEPCDHWGRTPPCSLAVIEAGVKRVFIGSRDPNPLVNGRGVARLRRAGVAVVNDVLREECDALNAHWFRFILSKRPHVTLKAAVTLDGKLAARGGDSRWVTGPEARAEVHRLRDRVDAVLVGAGTVLADDPRLTARLERGRGRDPVRVVLDSHLRLPARRQIFHVPSRAPTVVAHVAGAEAGRTALARLARRAAAAARVRGAAGVRGLPAAAASVRGAAGVRGLSAAAARVGGGPDAAARSAAAAGVRGEVQFLACRARGGRVDLRDLLAKLAARAVTSVLVEGGAEVHASFLAEGLVDRVLLYVAPKIVGGDGISWVAGAGVGRMADALQLEAVEISRAGEDIVVSGRPRGALAKGRRRG